MEPNRDKKQAIEGLSVSQAAILKQISVLTMKRKAVPTTDPVKVQTSSDRKDGNDETTKTSRWVTSPSNEELNSDLEATERAGARNEGKRTAAGAVNVHAGL